MEDRIMGIVGERVAAGESLREIIGGANLHLTDLFILKHHIAADERMGRKELAERLSLSKGALLLSMKRTYQKLAGAKTEQSEHSPNGKGPIPKRIAATVNEMLEDGQSLDGIVQEAGLNDTERAVLELYVLPDNDLTLYGASRAIGKSKATVTRSLKSMENKLLGRPWNWHLIENAGRLDDDELRQWLREIDVRSRNEARKADLYRYLVARKRGIVDEFFPDDKRLPELCQAVDEARGSGGLGAAIETMSPFEIDMIQTFALGEQDGSICEVAYRYGLAVPKVTRLSKYLAQKLNGEEVNAIPSRLRALVIGLDDAKLKGLMSHLDAREQLIMEKRVMVELPDSPATLNELGEELSMTRERVRQIEKRLLRRVELFDAEGAMPQTTLSKPPGSGKRLKLARGLVMRRLARGESIEDIRWLLDLNMTQRIAFDKCIVPESPESYEVAGSSIGSSGSNISSAIGAIIEKLRGKQSRITEARSIVRQKLLTGKDAAGIRDGSGLSEAEKLVFDRYIMAKETPSAKEIGEMLGKSSNSVHFLVKSITLRIEGKKRRKKEMEHLGDPIDMDIRKVVRSLKSHGVLMHKLADAAELTYLEAKALQLHHLLDEPMSVEEVAKSIGTTEKSVERLLRAAERKLLWLHFELTKDQMPR
jgi:DNA-directed RNA polymerase specialized sigma subunit